MSSLLSENFGYLLVSIEREIETPNMMPHSVSFTDAVNFFGQTSDKTFEIIMFECVLKRKYLIIRPKMALF